MQPFEACTPSSAYGRAPDLGADHAAPEAGYDIALPQGLASQGMHIVPCPCGWEGPSSCRPDLCYCLHAYPAVSHCSLWVHLPNALHAQSIYVLPAAHIERKACLSIRLRLLSSSMLRPADQLSVTRGLAQ